MKKETGKIPKKTCFFLQEGTPPAPPRTLIEAKSWMDKDFISGKKDGDVVGQTPT